MATPQEKPTPMGANAPSLSGRIVEITDQDETLMIAFVPVVAMAIKSGSGIGGDHHHADVANERAVQQPRCHWRI